MLDECRSQHRLFLISRSHAVHDPPEQVTDTIRHDTSRNLDPALHTHAVIEDGRMLDLAPGDPQLRHVDRAWVSTVHAFQGRTVDTVIAAMEANHKHLTTRKSFYVEMSRARDKAELVTDDRAALKEQLEAATGERIAALEAIEPDKAKGREAGLEAGLSAGRESGASTSRERDRSRKPELESSREPKGVDRGLGL